VPADGEGLPMQVGRPVGGDVGVATSPVTRAIRCVLAAGVAAALLAVAPAAAQAEEYGFVKRWGGEGSGPGRFALGGIGGMATDGAGNVYAVDSGNNRVQKFTSTGGFLGAWGSAGSGDGQFAGPGGIAIGAGGTVYVADSGNFRVQAFAADGRFLGKWGSEGRGNGQFGSEPGGGIDADENKIGPTDLGTDAAGNVYVLDTSNFRVQRFGPDGRFLGKWGDGVRDFSDATGITADRAGNVYVAEIGVTGGGRVLKFDSSGHLLTSWGARKRRDAFRFFDPVDLATDTAGNVYAAENHFDRVQKFRSNGRFVTAFGGHGERNGKFYEPSAITTDLAGNVYVADSNHYRRVGIHKFGLLPARPRVGTCRKASRSTRSRSACLRFRSSTARVRFQCRLTGEGVAKKHKRWRACASPARYGGLRAGAKRFQVRAVSPAGARSRAAGYAWRVAG
jgi:hypothetical protein